jgi:hypothetical protein
MTHGTKRWGIVTPVLLCILLTGCEWTVSITAEGTRDVVQTLVGDWFATTNGNRLHIRKYDARHYVIGEGRYGDNLYTAHHSDIDSWQLISVRQLQATGNDQWNYIQWRLIDAGHLEVRAVSEKVIPYSVGDRDEVVRLLKANRENPGLFSEPITYMREQ